MVFITARQTLSPGARTAPVTRACTGPRRSARVLASAVPAQPKDATSRRDAVVLLSAPLVASLIPSAAFAGDCPDNIGSFKSIGNDTRPAAIAVFKYTTSGGGVQNSNEQKFIDSFKKIKNDTLAQNPRPPGLVDFTFFKEANNKLGAPGIFYSVAIFDIVEQGCAFAKSGPIQAWINYIRGPPPNGLGVIFDPSGAVFEG